MYWEVEMAEQLLKPIIVLVTMVGVFVLLTASLTPVFVANQTETGYIDDPENYAFLGGYDYLKWYPADGYEIGPDNATVNSKVSFNSNELVFWEDAGGCVGGSNDIRCWIIMLEGYTAQIQGWLSPVLSAELQRSIGSWITGNAYVNMSGLLWHCHRGWWDDWWDFVPFDDILEETGQNSTAMVYYGKANFRLNTGYTTFIVNDSAVPLYTALNTNDDYTLHVGWTFYDKSQIEYSALDIIAGILTFNLPGVNSYITAIISIPIYATVAFIIFTVITRLIPFIGD